MTEERDEMKEGSRRKMNFERTNFGKGGRREGDKGEIKIHKEERKEGKAGNDARMGGNKRRKQE